jgi:ferredoxin
MQYTGAMKNIFGLVPSLAKSPFHARFSSREAFAAMIVDLNLAVKPAFALMDAIVGMEGSGPAAGNPRNVGLVMASSNLLAMDIAATQIMGYPPGETPVNKEALSRALWLSSLEEIEYPGLSPSGLQIHDFVKIPFKTSPSQLLDFILPRPLKRWIDSFAPGPEINHEICIRCGDCKRICDSQAINITGGENSSTKARMVIDYRRCIRCFCCHEICPVKAINVKKKPTNRY